MFDYLVNSYANHPSRGVFNWHDPSRILMSIHVFENLRHRRKGLQIIPGFCVRVSLQGDQVGETALGAEVGNVRIGMV